MMDQIGWNERIEKNMSGKYSTNWKAGFIMLVSGKKYF